DGACAARPVRALGWNRHGEDRVKKLVAALAVAGAVVALAVGPASAVQFGQPDNGEHPYVGLLVAYDSNWVFLWRCSGTLISSHRFLTAGHCNGFDPATGATPAHAQVWFYAGLIVPGDLSET